MSSNGRGADVIVVGAGHNGLVASCYLARAGLDVLVVEASERIGGCTTTEALVADAPEHLLNACAADVITMRSSTVVSDLELPRYGYREVDIDPAYAMLAADGASLVFWRDPARTAEEIRRFSGRDAQTYLELMDVFDSVLDAALPLIATNPTRPDPARVLQAIRAGARHPGALATAAGLATTTAAEAIQERFTHPVVQSGMAMITNFGSPITGEGTGANLMLFAIISRFGMGRPVGGMGALPGALARCLSAHGGRVRVSAPVQQLIVERGAVTGVRLASGEELHAATVLTATEPHRALTKLLPPGTLPDKLAARAAHIPAGNDGCTHFKVEMALRGRLELSRHQRGRPDDVDLRIPSGMVGSIEEISRAILSAKCGRLPDPLPFVSMVPTAADPSQAPDGQDTLSLWSGWLPHDPPQGWNAFKRPVAEAFVAHARDYYDGIDELEIGRSVESPEDISARTGVRDGNVYHVDVSLTRIGPLRPALGFGGYKTPVPGMYITGAGTHPGPSVSGIPGQQAARTILRELKLGRGRRGERRRGSPRPAYRAQSSIRSNGRTPEPVTDVIVVGAGHNGLVAACYLARAGLDVLVLEAANSIGGCTTSGPLVPGAPDHIFCPGASDIITLRASTIVADLELRRHGFEMVDIDPAYVALSEDGSSIAFWRDPTRTATEIRHFSAADGDAYLELARVADVAAAAMVPMLSTNPSRPDRACVLRAARAAIRHPRLLAAVGPLAAASAAQAIEERFSHPVVKGALAMLCAFGPPINLDGSGTSLVLPALIKRFGLGRARGGMQKLPDALERCLTERGGRVRTSAPVAELITRDGHVVGVRLETGEELFARATLTNCDPRTTLTKLLPPGTLPDRLAARAEHIPTMNEGATHLKVDVALRGRLGLPRHQAQRRDDLDLRFPGHLVGSFEQIQRAFADAAAGRLAAPMPFVGLVSTEADPLLAPTGQDTLYVWSGWTPHDPPEGWDELAEPAAEALIGHAASFYDGIEELEIGRHVEAWPELAARTRVPDGNILHVDGTLLRQGPLRPALGFGGYRTPVPGLYLTGAGTHPGGSVSGIPGQLAARVVLRDFERGGAPPVPYGGTPAESESRLPEPIAS
jgi:phytoene dehydrogenase-like protein